MHARCGTSCMPYSDRKRRAFHLLSVCPFLLSSTRAELRPGEKALELKARLTTENSHVIARRYSTKTAVRRQQ